MISSTFRLKPEFRYLVTAKRTNEHGKIDGKSLWKTKPDRIISTSGTFSANWSTNKIQGDLNS